MDAVRKGSREVLTELGHLNLLPLVENGELCTLVGLTMLKLSQQTCMYSGTYAAGTLIAFRKPTDLLNQQRSRWESLTQARLEHPGSSQKALPAFRNYQVSF